jgi:integrase
MAIVARKRKTGTTYYVVFPDSEGKRCWERSGPDKREAEMLERQRGREVKAGTYSRARRPTMPFGEFLCAWAPSRDTRNATEDQRVVERFLLSREWLARLPCEELRPRHSAQLVRELKGTVSEQTGQPLAEHYVSNIYGLFCSAVQEARRDELVPGDPCVLPRGLLNRKARRGTRVPYSRADVLALISTGDEAAVFSALAFFTGMREGEICGRRWRDWDTEAKPLGCLDVATQYNDRPLKTARGLGEHARKVPVHPVLERILDGWWRDGFEFVHGRKPERDDFIVPRRRAGKPNHTRSSGSKLWLRACAGAGVTNVSLHSTRHTFITLARRGGARTEVVERITHNATGSIVDQYTHWDWTPLCEAVLALDPPGLPSAVDARNEQRRLSESSSISGALWGHFPEVQFQGLPTDAAIGALFDSQRLHLFSRQIRAFRPSSPQCLQNRANFRPRPGR